jgi:hypothetical protein
MRITNNIHNRKSGSIGEILICLVVKAVGQRIPGIARESHLPRNLYFQIRRQQEVLVLAYSRLRLRKRLGRKRPPQGQEERGRSGKRTGARMQRQASQTKRFELQYHMKRNEIPRK